MGKEERTIWERLENIPRWIPFSLVIIIMVYALMNPLGLPISIGTETREFYEHIDELSSGDVVLISIEMDPASAAELAPAMNALLHHLFRKDVIVLFYPSRTDIYPQMYREYVEVKFDPYEQYGKVYGEDYMAYGFVAGDDIALTKLAQDLLFPEVDIDGNKLTDLEIMKELKDHNDIKAVINITSSGMAQFVRTWSEPYGVALHGIVMSMMLPVVSPYYSAGQIQSLISGASGSPEYELLIGKPGEGLKNTDALSLVHLLVIVLIFLGNIGYLLKRGG